MQDQPVLPEWKRRLFQRPGANHVQSTREPRRLKLTGRRGGFDAGDGVRQSQPARRVRSCRKNRQLKSNDTVPAAWSRKAGTVSGMFGGVGSRRVGIAFRLHNCWNVFRLGWDALWPVFRAVARKSRTG